MEDIRVMNVLAAESGLTYYIGMGEVMQAYTLLTLVDFFGDIPYSEALTGSEILIQLWIQVSLCIMLQLQCLILLLTTLVKAELLHSTTCTMVVMHLVGLKQLIVLRKKLS
jgi:hypothetical protein